jgi:hypothetical protein
MTELFFVESGKLTFYSYRVKYKDLDIEIRVLLGS